MGWFHVYICGSGILTMEELKLFMVLIGCRPTGRAIEQHDIFFGIATSMKELIPAMVAYWPEAKGKIHIDAWRQVRYVNGFEVSVSTKELAATKVSEASLYFINLGGYKPGDYEEYHYKMVVAGDTIADAITEAKKTAFFKHMGYKGARAHVDDKYGVDADDAYLVKDLLSAAVTDQYSILLSKTNSQAEDVLNIGYFKLDKL